ncbi:MAG TPA: anti-sigma factor [Mycobacteriales bacterium]|nr:anti-sigma factor [Mycobacteriales bacterium]
MTGPASRHHQEWDELAAGSALHALEPAEENAFLRHLLGCPQCQQTVAGFEATVTELATVAEPALPPKSLWAAIDEEIGRDARAVVAPGSALVRQIGFRRGGYRNSLLAAAAGAAVAAAISLPLTLGGGSSSNPSLLASSQVLGCLEQTGCHTVVLHIAGSAQPAAAALLRGTSVTLVADRLSPTTGTSIYVLWRIADGALQPVGGFRVTGAGLTTVDVGSVTGLAGTFAITEENGPGVPARTTRTPVAISA